MKEQHFVLKIKHEKGIIRTVIICTTALLISVAKTNKRTEKQSPSFNSDFRIQI